jgi:capsular exopolysaccharide synthesis family protein
MLPHFTSGLLRYLPLVIVAAAIGALSTYLAVQELSGYRVAAQFKLSPDDPTTALAVQTSPATQLEGEAYVLGEAAIFESEPVLSRVAGRFGKSLDATLDATRIEVNAPSQVVTVVATDSGRGRAAALANAVGDGYLAYRRELRDTQLRLATSTLDEQARALLGQIDSLRRQIARSTSETDIERLRTTQGAALSRYQAVFARAEELRAQRDLPVAGVEIVRRASAGLATPTASDRLAILGLLLGAIVAVAFALVREQYRDEVRHDEDVEDDTRMPVVGRVPRAGRAELKRLADGPASDDPVAEALRGLRLNLRGGKPSTVETVLVTSPARGDGKSFIAANLARVLARGGAHTILVSADLRVPTVERMLGATGSSSGLASLLTEGAGPPELDQIEAELQPSGIERLRVLPAGQAPGNPADLLARPGCAAVFGALRAKADAIVVDAPPVLAFSDALLLSEHSDVMLLVAAVGRTGRSDLRRAATLIRNAVVGPVYAVLNRDSRASAHSPYHVRRPRDPERETLHGSMS